MILAATNHDGLRDSYLRALNRYLATPDEAALADAYLLGRRALNEGVGLIEWVTVHGDALVAIGDTISDAAALARAVVFLQESLSAYEMTQRGYAETNRWLERLNDELRDQVAQKERLAEQLRESNAELEAFSYSVAHDLRAPLRHIAGFSEILVQDHGSLLDQGARGVLSRITDAVRRMADLIDGLLTLSRAGRTEPTRQSVDLSSRARAILARLREADAARDVVVQVADSMRASADPVLLDAILENLLGNAWKFTGKKARARIEVGVDATKTPPVFFVRDDGAGFDMAFADKLFAVFQRLHTRESFPGTGVGLATVQRLVRKHGGRIWAESQIDQGAVFYFTLAPDSP